MSKVSEILERAYAVFQKYPRKLSPATMHWSNEDPEIRAIQQRVKTTKLNALDLETLQKVVWNATAEERSFKHFLPRMLECIATSSWALGDLTVRLEPEVFRTWPEDEVRVLRDFFAALAVTDPRAESLLQACNERLDVSSFVRADNQRR